MRWAKVHKECKGIGGYRKIFENERGFTTIKVFPEIFCGKRLETHLFYREIRGAAALLPKTRELKVTFLESGQPNPRGCSPTP